MSDRDLNSGPNRSAGEGSPSREPSGRSHPSPPDGRPDNQRRIQFDDQARAEALAAIASMAWGDVALAASTITDALARAMEATTTEFSRWETADAGEPRFGDEFSLSPQEVENLSPECRLAYVARLVRSAGLGWGIATEFDGGALGSRAGDRSRPGSLIDELAAIAQRSSARHN
jgi:hypothetical protein